MDSFNQSEKGFYASNLKWLALITMLIDHIGATIVASLVLDNDGIKNGELIYLAFRCVGRLAFPIYIFLLLEGFKYTRSRIKYLGRLTLFAFISEIPFDMAFKIKKNDVMNGKLFEFTYQNVFFTLAIGFAAIMLFEYVQNKVSNERQIILLDVLIATFMICFASYIHCDYGSAGVVAIIIAYIYRNNGVWQFFMTVISLSVLCDLSEALALFDLYFIVQYNGKKGKGGKWLFYAFYPVHLLVLAVFTMVFC